MAKLNITVTRHQDRQTGRFLVTLSGAGGNTSARFDWPADLNRYIKHSRIAAEALGHTVTVHDETGEVR